MFQITGTDNVLSQSLHQKPTAQECSLIDKNDAVDTEHSRKTYECTNTMCLNGGKKVWSIDLRENLVVTRIKLTERRMYLKRITLNVLLSLVDWKGGY